MNSTTYGNGITAENLRQLLAFWPILQIEMEECRQGVIEDAAKLLNEDVEPFAWYFLYELPTREHLNFATINTVSNFSELLTSEKMAAWFKQLAEAPSQIGAIPEVASKIMQHFAEQPQLSREAGEKLRPKLLNAFGIAWSMQQTLLCVLYHGVFLNELIMRVRAGDDKALFDAIRMDATIIGCPSAMSRISKASILGDEKFFKKLKNAMNGKQTKRQQANFQKMRLVFEVLHEAGANKLSNAQLYKLFVEELNLYTSNDIGGGSIKALQKLAYTYMQKKTTT